MYKQFNPNPQAARVGDCTVRAICKATGQDWEKTYIDLCIYGLIHADMPSANSVWGDYLHDKGFKRSIIPNACPACYTVADFTNEHKQGTYVLGLNGHVVCVCDGSYYDSWDSGGENPVYYWEAEK